MDYPNTLPSPLASSFSGEGFNAFIRTDFDAGPARQRQRFTVTPHRLDVAWRFTPEEMLTFRSFFKTDINLGVNWFNMTLDLGDGMMNYVVRFIEPYKYSRNNNKAWDVSGRLEVENA